MSMGYDAASMEYDAVSVGYDAVSTGCDAVLMEYDAASMVIGSWCFEVIQCPNLQGSKCPRRMIACWCSVISKKNVILSYAAAKTSKLTWYYFSPSRKFAFVDKTIFICATGDHMLKG